MNNCLWRKKKKIFWNLISRKVENADHTCYKCRQLICNESMIKSKHLGVFWSFDQVFIWWKFCITGAEIHFTFTSSFFGFQRWVEHSSCSSRCEPKDFQSLRLLLPWSIWRHGTRWNWQKFHLKYFILKKFRWRSLQGLPLPSLWPSWSVLIFFDSSYLFCIWPFVMRHWHLFGEELNDGLFTCW